MRLKKYLKLVETKNSKHTKARLSTYSIRCLINRYSEGYLLMLLSNKYLPESVLLKLAKHQSVNVRFRLAGKKLPVSVIKVLVNDTDENVLFALLDNRKIKKSQFFVKEIDGSPVYDIPISENFKKAFKVWKALRDADPFYEPNYDSPWFHVVTHFPWIAAEWSKLKVVIPKFITKIAI